MLVRKVQNKNLTDKQKQSVEQSEDGKKKCATCKEFLEIELFTKPTSGEHRIEWGQNTEVELEVVADNFSKTALPSPRFGTLYILSKLITSFGLTKNFR